MDVSRCTEETYDSLHHGFVFRARLIQRYFAKREMFQRMIILVHNIMTSRCQLCPKQRRQPTAYEECTLQPKQRKYIPEEFLHVRVVLMSQVNVLHLEIRGLMRMVCSKVPHLLIVEQPVPVEFVLWEIAKGVATDFDADIVRLFVLIVIIINNRDPGFHVNLSNSSTSFPRDPGKAFKSMICVDCCLRSPDSYGT